MHNKYPNVNKEVWHTLTYIMSETRHGYKLLFDCIYCIYVIQWYIESCKMLFIWKKVDLKKKKTPKKPKSNMGSCPQVLVVKMTRLHIGKSVHRMGSCQLSKCTTSDFHAALFWFVYDTSAVRRPTPTIGVSLERKTTWLSTGENIFWKY